MSTNFQKTKNMIFRNSWLHQIGRNAYTDWFLSILLAFFVLCLGVFFSYSLYGNTYSISSVENAKPNPTGKAIFDEQSLSKVLGIYEDRVGETNNLIKGWNGVTDPSI